MKATHTNGLKGQQALSPGQRPGYKDVGECALKGQKHACRHGGIGESVVAGRLLLEVDAGVLNVVGCVVGLAGTGGLDVTSRYAPPYLAGRYLGVLQHEGTGGYDGPLPHLAAVEEGGAHADEGTVADGAGMNGDVMADGDMAADMCGTGVVGDVDTGAVLYVGAVADGDGSHIATHDGSEPDGALVAHGDVANDGCVLAEIAVAPPLRGETFV